GNGKINDFENAKIPTKDYEVQLIGLNRDREELYDRINRRVDIMLAKGLVDEVKSLKSMGFTARDIAMQGIGYKEIFEYLDFENEEITVKTATEIDEARLDEAIYKIKRNSRHLAKRQITWFKQYKEMRWIELK
ncbi:MAG: hypothetical protein ACRCUS_01515, partial [Anaerovoracaceae bacterium]